MVRYLSNLRSKHSITSLTPPHGASFHVPYMIAFAVARELLGGVEIPSGIDKTELQKKLATAHEKGLFRYIITIA
jgi:hypothetical protein